MNVKISVSRSTAELGATAILALVFVRQFSASPLSVTAGAIGLALAIPILLKKPEYALFFLVALFPFRDIHILSIFYLKRLCIWGLFGYTLLRQMDRKQTLFTQPLFRFSQVVLLFVIALGVSLVKTASELYSSHYITPAMLKSTLLSDALIILEEILLAYLLYYLIDTVAPIQRLIDVMLTVAAVVAVLGICQYYLGSPPGIVSFLFDPDYQFYGRATSVFSNPNGLGGFSAQMLVIAFISLIWIKMTKTKRFLFILPVLIFISWALILSFSRSAILQAFFGIGVAAIVYYIKICDRKLNWKIVGVTIVALGIMIVSVSFYDLYLRARLKFYNYNDYHAAVNWLETTSDFRRKHAAISALQTFWKHPLLGIGYNLFSAKGGAGFEYFGLPVHNQYLKILAELGLFGFLPFIAVLAVVVRTALKTWVPPPEQRVDPDKQMLMFLLLTAFSTIAFGFLFGDPLPIISSAGYFWLYAGAILLLDRQYHQPQTAKCGR